MQWIYLAVLGSFIWAVANVIGKYTLFSLNKETTFFSLLIGAAAAFSLLPFFHLEFSKYTILVGICWAIGYYFYVKGLFESEVSKAIALLLTLPIFVAVISNIMLGETLNMVQYLGILISVIGALTLSMDGKWRELTLSQGSLFMIASSFFFALSDVSAKYTISFIDPISTEFWAQMTLLPIGLIFFSMNRDKIKFGSTKLIFYSLFCGVLSTAAAFIFISSYSQTLVSMVAPIETVQPIFVLIIAVTISKIKPEWLKEDIGRNALAIKIAGMILLIAGVFLVLS